jgi:hypothetical protein
MGFPGQAFRDALCEPEVVVVMPHLPVIVLSCIQAEPGRESRIIGIGTIGFVASLGVVAAASRRGFNRDPGGA